jgi:hypothetical protein
MVIDRFLRMFLVVLGLICISLPASAQPAPDLERRVKDFSQYTGVFALLQSSPYARKFFDFTDKQWSEIESIGQRFEGQANDVKKDTDLAANDKLQRLKALTKKRDEEIRAVMLDFQLKLLGRYPELIALAQEGLTHSLANGYLAVKLELTVSEREAVRDCASEVIKEFEEEVAVAKRKAISKLRDCLPENKRKSLDSVLEPLLESDGTLDGHKVFSLEPDSARIHLNHYGLPPLSASKKQ